MAQLNDLIVTGASRLLNGLGVLGSANMDSIFPNTTETYDLGSSDKKWKTGYIKTISANDMTLAILTITNYATIGGGQAATATGTGALRVSGGLSATQNSFFGKSIILTPAASQGIKINAAYITSENTSNGEVIFQGGHLRFGGSTWAYDNWGGLKYDHSTKTVYLGIADGSIFAANSAQSGGTLALPGIRYLSINGKTVIDAVDGWLRINETKAYATGVYFGNNVVRTDGQLQVGDAGKQFYANSSGNGYFSNTLGIGGTNTSYKLYANGKTRVGDGAASTSTTTGGLIVGGGIGVSGNSYFGGTITATKFIGPLQGNADTATKLTVSAGAHYQPVYFSGGQPVVINYVSTHPEGTGIILPFSIGNDLSNLVQRGGSVSIYETSSTDYTAATLTTTKALSNNSDNLFDGSPNYVGMTLSDKTATVIVDIKGMSYYHSTHAWIDFGNGNWGASSVEWYILEYGSTTYKKMASGNGPYHHASIGNGSTGYSAIRLVLKNWNTVNIRIAQIGMLNYTSKGLRNTFMSTGFDDGIYRSITPAKNNTYNLGASSGKWASVYATTFNGALSGNATTSSYPYGFSSYQTNATWGNQTGTTNVCWNDSTGGSVDWRRDNPSSGKVSMKVDGRVYVNEGNTPVATLTSANGYWGMGNPDGGTSDWIRTTANGILPYQSGGASSLGTASWPFGAIYGNSIYGTLTGNASSATILKPTDNTSTTTYKVSTWAANTSGGYIVWREAFQNSNLGSDTGDIIYWLNGATTLNVTIDGNYYAVGSHLVLHAGNYSSYAAPASHGHNVTQISWGVTQNLTCTGTDSEWSIDMDSSAKNSYFHIWSGIKGNSCMQFENNTGLCRAPFGVYGGVWNDYAEYRNQVEEIKPGYCVASSDDGKVYKTSKKFQPCDGITSDTFGFAIGETDECKTPLAVAGRVLAYYNGDRNDYHAGDTVCAGPEGKVMKMTRDEILMWPDRIVGIVSEIPNYKVWGTGNVEVNDRIWIKIK